jgi:hypothetical protein
MDVDDLPETIDFNGPIGAPFSRSTMVRDRSFGWGAVNLRAMTHEKRSVSEARRGYGFAFGGSLKLGDKDTLMGQYTHVDGDIDQFYGFNGYAIAPGTGSITFDRNEGMVIGYAHVFSDKLRGNVSAGFNRGTSARAHRPRTTERSRTPSSTSSTLRSRRSTWAENGSTARARRSPRAPAPCHASTSWRGTASETGLKRPSRVHLKAACKRRTSSKCRPGGHANLLACCMLIGRTSPRGP